jgi:hypothetical protein
MPEFYGVKILEVERLGAYSIRAKRDVRQLRAGVHYHRRTR